MNEVNFWPSLERCQTLPPRGRKHLDLQCIAEQSLRGAVLNRNVMFTSYNNDDIILRIKINICYSKLGSNCNIEVPKLVGVKYKGCHLKTYSV